MYRTYSHHDRDMEFDEDELWPMLGILISILCVWTAFVHFLDWLTFDAIVWWLEPLTIIPMLFLLAMKEKYDSINPIYWWPMFWGTRVKLPEEDHIKIYPLDGDDLMKKHGGPLNVYIEDYEHIKFRKKRDAVMFGLRYF